jgi:hypothetical protein
MTEIVKSASAKLDISAQNAVIGLINEPKIGLHNLNEKVVNLEAITASNSEKVDVALR